MRCLYFRLALIRAWELGLDKVFIACSTDNIGSQKTIKANGDMLENVIEDDLYNEQVLARRY